jgi:hypothetical protein
MIREPVYMRIYLNLWENPSRNRDPLEKGKKIARRNFGVRA